MNGDGTKLKNHEVLLWFQPLAPSPTSDMGYSPLFTSMLDHGSVIPGLGFSRAPTCKYPEPTLGWVEAASMQVNGLALLHSAASELHMGFSPVNSAPVPGTSDSRCQECSPCRIFCRRLRMSVESVPVKSVLVESSADAVHVAAYCAQTSLISPVRWDYPATATSPSPQGFSQVLRDVFLPPLRSALPLHIVPNNPRL